MGWSDLSSSAVLRDKASIEYVKIGKEIDTIKCTVACTLHTCHLFHRVYLQ